MTRLAAPRPLAVVMGVILFACATLCMALGLVLWTTVTASANAEYAYDAPIHAYDTARHGVAAHASEVVVDGSRIAVEEPQGTVATVSGPLSVLLSKSVAANSGAGTVRHYTTTGAADDIAGSGGSIETGASGRTWLTADEYATGAEAQASLALPKTPNGYYEIPVCRVQCPVGPSTVAPVPPWRGGGTEITTTYPIDVSDLPFILFGGG